MGETTKITVESTSNLENAMKVAFATKDMQTINAHFGGAKEFVVYDVSKDGFELSGVIKTDTSELNGDAKTDFKVQALQGINIMYCESIGGTAAAKVIRGGINPMKTKLLFWSAILFLILGLNTRDSALFYFFSIHLTMLFIGAFLHKHTRKSQPEETVEPLPEASE